MKKLLVVDDSIDILNVIKTLFEMKGYQVYTLSNGRNICDVIKKIAPQLILLDVYLAEQNGIDICVEIKSKEHLENIPIIMMSAHSNLNGMMQACKPQAFVEKPFDVSFLISLVEEQLSKGVISN